MKSFILLSLGTKKEDNGKITKVSKENHCHPRKVLSGQHCQIHTEIYWKHQEDRGENKAQRQH